MMTSPALCTLIYFAALTGGLALTYASYRVGLVLTGKTPANSWTRGAQNWTDPSLITRMQHAHLNCVENLPVFAALVLAAFATNQLAVIDGLACVFLGLRLAQTSIHLISANATAVFIRANLWIAQILLMAYWALKLCGTI